MLRQDLILGEPHLHRVLATYVDYHNHTRPQQGLDQECPALFAGSTASDGPGERRDILGGVLHVNNGTLRSADGLLARYDPRVTDLL